MIEGFRKGVKSAKRTIRAMLFGDFGAITREANILRNERAALDDIAVSLTVFFILVGLVFVPIGVKSVLTVNKTDVGITSGSTTETIYDNIVPISFVVLIMAIIYMVKKG